MTTANKTTYVLKAELREIAQSIIALKDIRRDKKLPLAKRLSSADNAERLGRGYRIRHIAYCLLRGTPYKMIEPNCDPFRRPSVHSVMKIMKEYGDENNVYNNPW